jgi:hypothetical protein
MDDIPIETIASVNLASSIALSILWERGPSRDRSLATVAPYLRITAHPSTAHPSTAHPSTRQCPPVSYSSVNSIEPARRPLSLAECLDVNTVLSSNYPCKTGLKADQCPESRKLWI